MVAGECFVKKQVNFFSDLELVLPHKKATSPTSIRRHGNSWVSKGQWSTLQKEWVFHINVNLLQGAMQNAGFHPVSSAGASCSARWEWVNASRMGSQQNNIHATSRCHQFDCDSVILIPQMFHTSLISLGSQLGISERDPGSSGESKVQRKPSQIHLEDQHGSLDPTVTDDLGHQWAQWAQRAHWAQWAQRAQWAAYLADGTTSWVSPEDGGFNQPRKN